MTKPDSISNSKLPLKIPIYRPYLHGKEKEYIARCIDSTQVSSKWEFLDEFEHAFRKFIKAPYVTAVCNGTVSLHLALLPLGISPKDEFIVPALTFVASANAISYCGAVPVFADSDPNTWQICPKDIAKKSPQKQRRSWLSISTDIQRGGKCLAADLHR